MLTQLPQAWPCGGDDSLCIPNPTSPTYPVGLSILSPSVKPEQADLMQLPWGLLLCSCGDRQGHPAHGPPAQELLKGSAWSCSVAAGAQHTDRAQSVFVDMNWAE